MILTEEIIQEVKASYLAGYENGCVDGNQAAVEAKVSKFIDAHTKPWVGLTEQDLNTIVKNAISKEWAVLMTEVTLKEKNA